jgi:dihydrofolate reductase
MSKVFVLLSMSLDGYVAPDGMDMEHASEPTYKDWMANWSKLQGWVFPQKFFRENLQLGEGGETGAENQLLEDAFTRTGVSIMGKRMFDGGEKFWPEEAPFHTPVFVCTHTKRAPWERPGGTTFYFVNDGIESAMHQAKESAQGRDIRIAGGGNTVMQFLNAGLVDELRLAIAPLVLGEGVRLFDGIDRTKVSLELVDSFTSKRATHVHYNVSSAR